ncbi:uncharacterized protein LOC118189306 [Stegodyphus dumicola]|uniref:uncharacterized protein LOC118189306 n=1 Tax=Stegodyphus dumicola TaxID=202533 RepID=UPI0015AA7096|nr:uncharacterized protein LOC118189306 [Stegodyphus dumicola]
MAHSKPFQSIEEALVYFYTLSDDEECIDICQLPPKESGYDEISQEISFDPQEPSSSKGKKNVKRKLNVKEKNSEHRWGKNLNFNKILKTGSIENICEVFPKLVTLSPVEVFHKFLTREYLLHLANMTGLYTMQKGEVLAVDENDIGQFFELLLFSGYHGVPGEDLYWSTQEDLSVLVVSSVMPRNRFRK